MELRPIPFRWSRELRCQEGRCGRRVSGQALRSIKKAFRSVEVPPVVRRIRGLRANENSEVYLGLGFGRSGDGRDVRTTDHHAGDSDGRHQACGLRHRLLTLGPDNTADQLRSSVACAGFVSCIRLLCGSTALSTRPRRHRPRTEYANRDPLCPACACRASAEYQQRHDVRARYKHRYRPGPWSSGSESLGGSVSVVRQRDGCDKAAHANQDTNRLARDFTRDHLSAQTDTGKNELNPEPAD